MFSPLLLAADLNVPTDPFPFDDLPTQHLMNQPIEKFSFSVPKKKKMFSNIFNGRFAFHFVYKTPKENSTFYEPSQIFFFFFFFFCSIYCMLRSYERVSHFPDNFVHFSYFLKVQWYLVSSLLLNFYWFKSDVPKNVLELNKCLPSLCVIKRPPLFYLFIS